MVTRQQNGTVYFAYIVSRQQKKSKEFPKGYTVQTVKGYALVKDDSSPDGYSSAATADCETISACKETLNSKRNMDFIKSLFVEAPAEVDVGDFDVDSYGGTMRGAFVAVLEAIKARGA